MECLKNFIGVSNRCEGTPASKSGLYIEDLEGISVKSLANIEAGKYLTVQAMIDAKLRVVGAKMLDTISGMINGITVETAADSLISKSFGEDYFAQANGSPGLKIKKYPTSFSSIFINTLYFKSHTAVVDLDILVDDGVNPQIFTISADADEEVTIECNYSTLQSVVTITYTSDAGPSDLGVSPYTEDISSYGSFYIPGSRDCSGCDDCGHRYFVVKGIGFDGSEKSSYYGLRPNVSLVCDREKMVCLLAPMYKTTVLYALGVELVNEWIPSDRLNFLAMGSKEWAKEKSAEWQNKVAQTWFDNSEGIKNLLTHTESKCFKCTGYQYYERIP